MSLFDKIVERLAALEGVEVSAKKGWIQPGKAVFYLAEKDNQLQAVEGVVNSVQDLLVKVEKLSDAIPYDFVQNTKNFVWLRMDDVHLTPDELYDSYSEIFREEPEEKESSYLAEIVRKQAWYFSSDEDFYENLTDKNIYHKVVAYIHEFLDEYSLNGVYELKFDNIKNASFKEGGVVERGDINLTLEIRTISGVKVRTEMIVPVRKGKFIEPSVIFLDGNPRVIAQTTFDDIVKSGIFERRLQKNPEDIYSQELLQKYQEISIPLVQMGLYRD